jgi:hypothetical protein
VQAVKGRLNAAAAVPDERKNSFRVKFTR